jgi:biopolymer transport protein ExbD
MASHSHDGEFGFQIAPMLDVLFVLLLFFMVTAGMQKREATLSVPLPGSTKGPSDVVPVNLNIAADGQILFNGGPVDAGADARLPETIERLKAVLNGAPDRPVIIEPDASARHQRVVDVLNACKAAMARNVVFASVP